MVHFHANAVNTAKSVFAQIHSLEAAPLDNVIMAISKQFMASDAFAFPIGIENIKFSC